MSSFLPGGQLPEFEWDRGRDPAALDRTGGRWLPDRPDSAPGRCARRRAKSIDESHL